VGIAHGDIYAHNIKVDPNGRAYLLDLGASHAFSLHPQFMHEAKSFEMRAYCLLSQELLERVYGTFEPYSTLFTTLLEECKKLVPTLNLSTLLLDF
jgi:serine/threonine protein kinase